MQGGWQERWKTCRVSWEVPYRCSFVCEKHGRELVVGSPHDCMVFHSHFTIVGNVYRAGHNSYDVGVVLNAKQQGVLQESKILFSDMTPS